MAAPHRTTTNPSCHLGQIPRCQWGPGALNLSPVSQRHAWNAPISNRVRFTEEWEFCPLQEKDTFFPCVYFCLLLSQLGYRDWAPVVKGVAMFGGVDATPRPTQTLRRSRDGIFFVCCVRFFLVSGPITAALCCCVASTLGYTSTARQALDLDARRVPKDVRGLLRPPCIASTWNHD